MLTFGSKLNRSYTLHLPFLDAFTEITVLFNKANSFVGFNLDQSNYIKSREGQIKSFIFNDLNRSAFAMSFLDLRSYRSKNLDIINQFNNILPEYRDRIQYETNETCKLSKISTTKGNLESCLYIYIFKIIDFGNNFLFCLTERQHIDTQLDRKVVRTSAIQISSNQAYEDVASMVESSNRKITNKSQSIDNVKDFFGDKENVKENV